MTGFQEIDDEKEWNDGVLRLGGDFTQSWEWGDFQRNAGKELLRLGSEGFRLQAVKKPLPLGRSYWYAPRGPVFAGDSASALEAMSVAGRGGASVFFRFEPDALADIEDMLDDERVVKTRSIQPPITNLLDIGRDPEAILAGMHPKWRYNIRLAEKKGVRVIPGPSSDDGVKVFWDLLLETTGRGGFRGHPHEYYEKMLFSLKGDPTERDGKAKARLLFAEHDGKVLAAMILIYFGGTVTYLHGASSRDRRELMAPHLLHWKAIEEARAWGYCTYDFWGVAPKDDAGHVWAGISRFKRGFGGTDLAYPGAFDLILDPKWYRLYRFAQRVRGR